MYVTNASASRALSNDPLPPHQRYLTDRVAYVYQLAKDAGEDFAVLSAEYGLVFGDQSVPFSDHGLSDDEVEKLAAVVAEEIEARGVKSITFWALPQEWSDPARSARRYSKVLERARQLFSFHYAVQFIDAPLGGRERGRPTPEPGHAPEGEETSTIRPENVGFGGPHSMNKQSYQLRAQDEKGLWQDVRQSTFLPDLQIKARSLVKEFPDRKVEIVPVADNKPLPF
jgi:hypothetical protein